MIAVYVVTYRRPALLKRALASVRAQSHPGWVARVINDDPEDSRVAEIVRGLRDPRIRLVEPSIRQGPTRAFNQAFGAEDCEYVSLLEDDNWWETGFLQRMVESLESFAGFDVACSNEKIWKELPNGDWQNTNATVWPTFGLLGHETSPLSACEGAKICNSSMLVRRAGRPAYLTPDDIPVDVTEHFRERVLQQPILLVGEALANYAITISTARSAGGSLWAQYQAMLIASIFASLPIPFREDTAAQIFSKVGRYPSPRSSSMLSASLVAREAMPLWRHASNVQRARFIAGLMRRPTAWRDLRAVRRKKKCHWEFLLNSRCNKRWMAQEQKINECGH